MRGSDDRLGDKLGPRLAQLWLTTTMGARAALAPHEARVRSAATQEIINRIGDGVADLWSPFTRQMLASDELHPDVRTWLEKVSSGAHQEQAVLGHQLLSTVAGSVLSTVISNELAPFGYGLVGINPHLLPDPGTLVQLAATGWVDQGHAELGVREQGYHSGWYHAMWNAAFSWPGLAEVWQLMNRGAIGQNTAALWLERAGVHPEARAFVLALRRQLLSPADAALGVLRGDLTPAAGEAIARANGVDRGDFATLLANTGEPLGEQQLAEALRRGFIDRARFARGIRQSRIRNEWLDVAEALRYQPVPTADAVDAALRHRITWAQAKAIAEQNGIEPSEFKILEDNAGSPPGDMQLLELWRRGKITQARVVEGLRFGRLRDEWIPDLQGLKYEPLSAPEVADAWLRGHVGQEQAADMMAAAGLDPADVPLALANAGNPLGLVQLLEALRRGFIDRERFITGFRESRYRNEWADTALKLRYSPMSTADAVEASIQGWLTKAQAAAIAQQNGLEERDFEPLWQTAGMPLSRTELEQLYNRGLISEKVVRQGLRESRLKDKYIPDAVQLHVRLPQPREVVTALTDGVVTRQLATRLLGDMGYEKDVVAMLIATGEVRSTGPHRQLLTAEISKLYADRIIDEATALGMLTHLHYTPESAHLIVRLADYEKQRRILDSGIAAVKAHYLAHRIDEATAAGDLHAMNLPPAAADTYLKVWRLDRLAHPKRLSEAQIVKANKLGLFVPRGQLSQQQWVQANYDAAHARLVALGYDSTDAGLLLAGA